MIIPLSNTSIGRSRSGRAQTLIRRLWTTLETKSGRRIGIQELSEWLNLSDSTVSDWMNGKTELNQIESLLRLCERLSNSNDLLGQHLRRFPTIDSPELVHDPAASELLRELFTKKSGVTFIVGGNETQRTFLITAIGHSYLSEHPGESVAGWDVHTPSWFVPLVGVYYSCESNWESRLSRVAGIPNCLIISNGLWQNKPSHREYIMKCAAKHHIIATDYTEAPDVSLSAEEKLPALQRIVVAGDATKYQVSITHSSPR
jgi:DNA-binding Xre family transcriptional regulator